MTDYDLTDGGRRRIVSEDQAKNLREQAELRVELDQLLAEGHTGCDFGGASDLDAIDDEFRRIGEGSQDFDGDDPA
ncbi:hypothetical protein ACTXJK_09665 [Brachybacterium tyrofermentans]|uniref:hypothetical protein n=1 Tax=Brachybacterium tyrofermentans TaxID=47848 RepID=UPI003FCEF2B2